MAGQVEPTSNRTSDRLANAVVATPLIGGVTVMGAGVLGGTDIPTWMMLLSPILGFIATALALLLKFHLQNRKSKVEAAGKLSDIALAQLEAQDERNRKNFNDMEDRHAARMKELREENQVVRNDLKDSKRQIDAVQANHMAMIQRLEDLAEDNNNKERELRHVSAELARTKEDLRVTKAQRDSANAEKVVLVTENALDRARHNKDMKDMEERYNKRIEDLTIKIAALEQEVQQLKDEMHK